MEKIRVKDAVTVIVDPTVTRHYEPGLRSVPNEHADRIVHAGAGTRMMAAKRRPKVSRARDTFASSADDA